MPRAQAIRRAVEVSSKILDGADVRAYGFCRVVTSLEFFQHYFAKSGHKDLLMTRQLTLTARQPPLRSPHAKRPPRQRLRANGQTGNLKYSPQLEEDVRVLVDCSDSRCSAL